MSSPENDALEGKLREVTAQLHAITAEFDHFSHAVSHDLRAPLRALEGFAQILLEDYGAELDDEGRRCLEILGVSARKVSLLVEDLLGYSRLFQHPLAPGAIRVDSLVEESLAGVRAESATPLPAQIHVAALPDAWGDRELIGEVWERLLSNAIKFSGGLGAGAIIEIGGREECGRTIYFIHDNGAGFEPKYADRLFGVFQRLHGETEFPGRGIGLATVKRIVTMHRGEVWAEGRPKEGATFYFALPKRP